MNPEPIQRRTGTGTPYEQYPRCNAKLVRYRCTLPKGHLDERVEFHATTDGRGNSFIWSAKA